MSFYTYRAPGQPDIWKVAKSPFGGYVAYAAGYRMNVPDADREVVYMVANARSLYEAATDLLISIGGKDTGAAEMAISRLSVACLEVEKGFDV